jgi:N-acetylglucosaminyldiphosphoundecaprenol N-acetyl-beta-D-mannosaminyltransferase
MPTTLLAPAAARSHAEAPRAQGEPIEVWGLPLTPLTMAETLGRIDRLVRRGRPEFVITANLNFAMLASSNARLRAAVRKAAFVVADGMPLVWAAQWKGRPLPERVTGADLVPALCRMAAAEGHSVLLVGGGPGVATAAAERMRHGCDGLRIAALDAPSFRTLKSRENDRLIGRIRKERPQLLLLACSQPEGEIWLAENCRRIGVPVSVQVGAAVDFAAGRAARAPRWVQGLGLEWLYRMCREPRRLAPRYWRNAMYLATTPL